MKNQRQRVGEIWADWNERKINGEVAIHQVGKIFSRSVLKEWNRRMKEKEAVE